MAIYLIDKIKPKNNGAFAMVDAADVEMPDGTRLSDFKGGVSPTVTVTAITGGHRVTITDENGKQVFDVMDGKDGSGASVSIVDNLGSSDPNAALSARMGGVLKTKIEDDVSALNEQLQPQINQRVKTVNGKAPDENGNVEVTVGNTVTDEHINALIDAKLGVIENGTY